MADWKLEKFRCSLDGQKYIKNFLLMKNKSPGSTTMPAAASEMIRYIFSGSSIAQGPGKTTKSPKYTTKILYWLRNDL